MRAAVRTGRIAWISVLEQNSSGARPTREEQDRWELIMAHPKIPVLRGKEEQHVLQSIGGSGGPAAILLDARTMRVMGGGMTYGAMDLAMENL